jgi:23S rRNA pseudouridine1911/1915/1917 synthase
MSGTLVNALMYHCGNELSGINGVLRPGIVHRIDRNTTGSLVVCKTDAAHRSLAEQLRDHSITRKYRAIVYGNIKEDTGTVDAPIGRHPVDRKKMAVNRVNGREAVTHYRVLERFGRFTYIECQLETGRTHQIRVHMTSAGHPLLGDDVYGPASCPFHLEGQTLHAMVLGFIHPVTGAYMEFTAPLPPYFENLLEQLRR